MYKPLQDYLKSIGKRPIVTIHAPLTPLLLCIPWTRQDHIPMTLAIINRGRESVAIVDEEMYRQICSERLDLYWNKKMSLKEFKDEFQGNIDGALKLYNKTRKIDFKKATEQEIIDILNEVIICFDHLADTTIYIELLDEPMILNVIGQDRKDFLHKIWEEATHPTFVSFEARRLEYVINLIKDVPDLDEIVPQVRFIYTDYHWTKKDSEILAILTDIKNNLREKEEEVKKAKKAVEEKKKSYDAWRSTLSKEELFLVDYIQMTMEFRDVRKDPIGHIQAMIVEIATELFNRAGIDVKYAIPTTIYEISKGVEYLKNNKEDIESRTKGFAVLVYNDATWNSQAVDYDETMKEFNEFVAQNQKKETTIKGQIANKGFVKGVARIVLDPHHDKGFNDGDILVTSMTRPEFVPLMKRAGAVVTNEGGVTCHAAIVSRELGIPCVIGTRNATHMIKDGAMVEVDANTGLIKIL